MNLSVARCRAALMLAVFISCGPCAEAAVWQRTARGRQATKRARRSVKRARRGPARRLAPQADAARREPGELRTVSGRPEEVLAGGGGGTGTGVGPPAPPETD